MTNAPGARGRGQSEDAGARAEAEPLFPSEGAFSTVVPLSQVQDGLISEGDSAAVEAAAPEEEEATLVPARVSPATRARHAPAARRVEGARRVGRRWLAPMAAVFLSISAGVVAGAYMVWTRQAPPVTHGADAPAPSQSAPKVAPPEPTQVAPPEAAAASAPSAEVVKVERSERADTSAEVGKPEPPSRRTAETERRAAEAEPRAARRAGANAGTVEAAPAPKPSRDEAAPRRRPARPKPNATAAAERALPVSSPPPSAKSRTVIQWP